MKIPDFIVLVFECESCYKIFKICVRAKRRKGLEDATVFDYDFLRDLSRSGAKFLDSQNNIHARNNLTYIIMLFLLVTLQEKYQKTHRIQREHRLTRK